MNIVISWTGLTGYTGANWRALQARAGVRLKVYVEATVMDQEFRAERELAGLDYRMLARDEVPSREIEDEVAAFAPDVFFVVGWRAKSCRWFACNPRWAQVKKVLVCDMPFAWTLRKIAARFILAPYLRRFAAAFVPGAGSVRYMRWLGFGGTRPIFTGLNGTDVRRFASVPARQTGGTRRFLYIGRYSEEKGLDVLMSAYGLYRSQVEEPWDLDCVGAGACAACLQNQEGVHDLGFKAPDELAVVYAAHDAFVLPSRFEPWGLVLVEAAGAGLPIICTKACGAADEVVRENGLVVKTGDAAALAAAMVRIHRLDGEARAAMGAAGRALAAPHDSLAWAKRVEVIVKQGRRLVYSPG